MNDDLISRQAVIEALRTCYDTHTLYDENNGDDYILYDEAVGEIENLPSIQPKTGRWVYTPDSMGINYSCSLCGKKCYFAVQYDLLGNEYTFEYCPHCGTKMQSGCFKEES